MFWNVSGMFWVPPWNAMRNPNYSSFKNLAKTILREIFEIVFERGTGELKEEVI